MKVLHWGLLALGITAAVVSLVSIFLCIWVPDHDLQTRLLSQFVVCAGISVCSIMGFAFSGDDL